MGSQAGSVFLIWILGAETRAFQESFTQQEAMVALLEDGFAFQKKPLPEQEAMGPAGRSSLDLFPSRKPGPLRQTVSNLSWRCRIRNTSRLQHAVTISPRRNIGLLRFLLGFGTFRYC